MEEWFKQQEYFTEEKLAKIKTWMENEIINLSSFNDHFLAS